MCLGTRPIVYTHMFNPYISMWISLVYFSSFNNICHSCTEKFTTYVTPNKKKVKVNIRLWKITIIFHLWEVLCIIIYRTALMLSKPDNRIFRKVVWAQTFILCVTYVQLYARKISVRFNVYRLTYYFSADKITYGYNNKDALSQQKRTISTKFFYPRHSPLWATRCAKPRLKSALTPEKIPL